VLAVLAAAPIGLVLLLMVGRGWSATRAGALTAAGTLPLAVVAFGFGGPGTAYGPAAGTLGLFAEACFTALTVLAIVGPALALHHLQQRTGATSVLRSALSRLTPDPRVAALLLAWFFPLFLEGAAGFGTPVALAAPFLVASGFRPITAVTAALVGHAAGVSFGALGTPVVAQMAATGVSGRDLAAATAPYHALLGWLLTAVVVVLVGRAVPSGRPPWAWGALAAASFFVPYLLLARLVGPELPTIGAALAGAVVFLVTARLVAVWTTQQSAQRSRQAAGTEPPVMREPGLDGSVSPPLLREANGPKTDADADTDTDTDTEPSPSFGPARAAAPYLALLLVVLITRLVPPVRETLFTVTLEWRVFADFSGEVRPLYHPGVLLPLAFAVGAVAQRASRADVLRAVATTNRQLAPVAVALVAMVLIARTMSQSGMTDELAAAAAGAGAAWPLLAPAVGALGTFVTGSATASNILFTEFQQATAEATGRDALPLLGAQGFGAAVGNIICPHNIVAAAATVGLSGQEGRVLRRTLPVALAYVALGGGVALLRA
jgi:lactate permease